MSQPTTMEDPVASSEPTESMTEAPAPARTPENDAPPPTLPLSPASSTSTLPQGEAVVPPAPLREERKEREAEMKIVQITPSHLHASTSNNNNDTTTNNGPRWCYGVRAYDGGYYDVGSFFVFHEEEQGWQSEGEGPISDSSISNKIGGQVIPAPKFSSQAVSLANGDLKARAAVVRTNATPFGYLFVDGMKVTRAGDEEGGKMVSGAESDVAVQAYAELEKQAAVVRRAVGIDGPTGGRIDDAMEDDGEDKLVEDDKSIQDRFLALGNTDDNESVQGLLCTEGCTWLGTFGLPPAPEGEEEETVDLWPKRILRFADVGEYGVLALDGNPDATGSLVAVRSPPPPPEKKEQTSAADDRDRDDGQVKTESNTEPDSESAGDVKTTNGKKNCHVVQEPSAEDGARKAFALMSRALSELRTLMPNLPVLPSRSPSPTAASTGDSAAAALAAASSGEVAISNGSVMANGNRVPLHGYSNGDVEESHDDTQQQQMVGCGKRGTAQMSLRARKSSGVVDEPGFAAAGDAAAGREHDGGRDKRHAGQPPGVGGWGTPGGGYIKADAAEELEERGRGAEAAAAAAAVAAGGGSMTMESARNGSGSRKRPRAEGRGPYPHVKPDPELLENGMGGIMEDYDPEGRTHGGGSNRSRTAAAAAAAAAYRGIEPPFPSPPPAGPGDMMDDDDGGAGAGEMTVVAVRTSLLRNRADEGPSPDEGEWEARVRNFIRYVEGLPPGPTQEELSLMFAAALDPTLVRMRAANNLLVELAELCALPDPSLGHDEDEDGDDDLGGPGPDRLVRRQGFKVRLELDAADGDEPPPEGLEYLLKVVGAARGAIEAAARARACVAAAGDTLGGLHELKADYTRSLPFGPRQPIQSIIEEEQARVRGYTTAHEDIEGQRVHELRLRGRDVGDAYRGVQGEPGWSGVRRQVDGFLRRFASYCAARLPEEGSDPRLLGLDVLLTRPVLGGGGAIKM